MWKRILHNISPFLGLFLFVVALGFLYHALKGYHYQEVMRQMWALPRSHVLLAFLITILGYLVLTAYDSLAFQYIRHPLRYGKIALASFIGYAFSNTMGHSLITGGSIRYRLYSSWGLSAIDISKVVAFCIATFWLGFFTLGGAVFLLWPLATPPSLHLPISLTRPVGFLLLSLVGFYLFWTFSRKGPFRVRQWEFSLPSPALSCSQIFISTLDWCLAGSVLYVLLPPDAGVSYPQFLGIFLLAQMTGWVSQVPGGIGVFETVVIFLLSDSVPASSLLGSLLAYRCIYYLLPLGIAVCLLGTHELLERKHHVQWVTRVFGRWVPELVPQVLAFSTFVGGAVLLFSGATPPVTERLSWLQEVLPLPVMEGSHFLGSLVGVGLLFLARGIQQRLDAAYFMSAGLLGGGIAFSLLKGLDYEEAIILGIMLGTLLPCRGHFYRKASILSQRFTPGWVTAIILILLTSTWLGIFSFKHVEYSSDLWWQFSLFGDAPRFMRATVGAVAVTLFFGVSKLLRASPPEPVLPTRSELERADGIIRNGPETFPNLALLGDKALLFHEKGTAFLMYGIEGRSWVALGDPVGPEKDGAELVWRFREMCDRHDGWTVFYQVRPEHLPLYLDLGLTLLKLGEEARVLLNTFSLEGGSRKGLRYVYHRLEKEGCTFEVVPPEGIPPLIAELQKVSDTWLAQKNRREKRFSMGFFDADYLRWFPVGVIRQEGEIVAFANIWTGGKNEELSVDLMRYVPTAPQGVMEFLFIHLMLWGKEKGYAWFNLGMAPLSGLEDRSLAPLWTRLGAFVFRHGEHFYNFQGLREYKEKFDPQWGPIYLASPGGLALPHILADIATLIGGGVKGVIHSQSRGLRKTS